MIRPATPDDHEVLLDLWEDLNRNGSEADPRYRPTADARAQMKTYTANSWFEQVPFPRCLVADDDGVVGFIHGFPRTAVPVIDLAPTVRIGDLYVAPSHRRSGVGRSLVQAMPSWAKAAGHPRAEVGTLTADARAVAFWRSMGFGDWQISLSRD